MSPVLPPGVTAAIFARALRRFAAVVGDSQVFASDEDRASYSDSFAIDDGSSHAPAAAVAPATVPEIQAIVRAANEYRVPLWPVSRGRNLAYGGSAPRMRGTVVLDLSRMQRIIEVDASQGWCRVEPGVGFYDLYDYIKARHLPLWVSLPKHAWGSVVGNALERGLGETAYGDHAQQICGMEVVLPDGELLRTGMGAKSGSGVWSQFKHGFGPGWDSMFCQSNLGIVTSMGLWLMPEPEATVVFRCKAMTGADVEPVVAAVLALKRCGVVDAYLSMVSWLGIAGCLAQRREFYDGPGAMPEDVVQQLLRKLDIGWWNLDVVVTGTPEVAAAKARRVEQELARSGRIVWSRSDWRQGDATASGAEPVPGMRSMQFINWYGGRGAHVDFSPVMPADAAEAARYFRATYDYFNGIGHDFFAAYHFGPRNLIAPTNIIFDRTDATMTARVRRMFGELLRMAGALGMSEYRTHLDYMDEVARTFDYNDHALLRLNERIKDCIDPQGILAPGKSGVWPRAYRGRER